MNYTRVLHALSHPQPAVTPLDLAKCLTISQRQPLYQLLSMSPLKPARRLCQPVDYPQQGGLRSSGSSSSSSHGPSGLRSCLRRYSSGAIKKRVVFADTKGLALAAVRLFIPEPSSPASTLMLRASPDKPQPSSPVSTLMLRAPLDKPQPSSPSSTLMLRASPDKPQPSSPTFTQMLRASPDKPQSLSPASTLMQRHRLRLGFPQPALDFKGFLTRLRDTNVQLESCSVSERSLSGKVCTAHVNADKAAYVRLTFDSWWSHHDIPCTFSQQQRYGGSDVDVFTFDINLPQNLDPKERIEFCVSFRPGPCAAPHWDDNGGQNYRLHVEKDESTVNLDSGSHFYPTLSKNCPPLCPSYLSTSLQKSRGLQYPQRSLSSEVKAEWKTLVSTN